MTAKAQRNLTHTLAPQARERLSNTYFSTWEIAARAAQHFTARTGHRPMIRLGTSHRGSRRWHLDLTGAPPPGRITIRTHPQRGKDKRDAGLSLKLSRYDQVITCDGSTARINDKTVRASWALVTSAGHYRTGALPPATQANSLLAEAVALAHTLLRAATGIPGQRTLILLDCLTLISGGDPVGVLRSMATRHPDAGIPIAKLTRALADRSYSIDIAHVRSHQPLEKSLPARTWLELADTLAGSHHGNTLARQAAIAQCMALVDLTELRTRTPHLEVTIRRV